MKEETGELKQTEESGATLSSAPFIIDYGLSPPEAPYVSQAVQVSAILFNAANTHQPSSSSSWDLPPSAMKFLSGPCWIY